jgi:sulfite exporter TauE/SafE
VGLQQAVGVVAGLFMVATGLGFLSSARWLQAVERVLGARVFGTLRKLQGGAGPGRPYVAGLWFGFLPCGLSYSSFLGAAATGSALHGFLYALLFALGTVPALLVVGVAVGLAGQRWRLWVHRLGGALVVLTGIFFLVNTLRPFLDR